MTRPALPLLSAVVACAFLVNATAQDKKPANKPKEPAPTRQAKEPQKPSPFSGDLHVIAEFIEVEHEAFSDWLLENSLKADATDLRREVQRWVKEGDAEIVETTVVHARSGNRAKVESIEEVIYPTEYDPSEVPSHATAQDGAEIPVTAPTATAFETRNVGVTLEIEPNVRPDRGVIDLRIAPEIVDLLGLVTWQEYRDQWGNSDLRMPIFESLRTSQGMELVPGRHALMGLLSPKKRKGKEEEKVLLFVKATLVEGGPVDE